MLYLVATPIGHLQDITLRALEGLKACDYLLCEDTRHSSRLLQRYEIHKPLKSYHKFNLARREAEILSDLKAGKIIGLLSDAGTPAISDPGQELVAACRRESIPVTALPGPCAAIVALSASGFDATRFQFVGFLPKKPKALEAVLRECLTYPGTSIAYESPYRLLKVLLRLQTLEATRSLCVARELTKTFEEFRFGTASELHDYFTHHPLKGEIVLLFSAADEHSKP